MRIGIIGQGFAGSALAVQLKRRGYEVVVFDKGLEGAASWVASGLFNPIVLKRRRVIGEAALHIAEANQHFDRVAQILGAAMLDAEPIREILDGAEALNHWSGPQAALAPYLGPTEPIDHPGIQKPWAGQVIHSGRVQSKAYLKGIRQWLGDSLRDVMVDHIERHGSRWVVAGESCDALILAEGAHAALTEAWFGPLPFAKTKGEGLTIQWNGPAIEKPYHQSHFLLPEPHGQAKTGATYAWDDMSLVPTQAARETLLKALNGWFQMPDIEVVDHWTGIRPTMKNRQVKWGWHEDYPTLGFINGLGSRGALTAPLHTKRLLAGASFLVMDEDVHPGHATQTEE